MTLIDDIPTCADLVQQMVLEAADALGRTAAVVSRARL
jgi:hypothetical protein